MSTSYETDLELREAYANHVESYYDEVTRRVRVLEYVGESSLCSRKRDVQIELF